MLCPNLALLRVIQYCQRKPLHLCLFSELKVPQQHIWLASPQGDHVKVEDDGVAQGDEVQGVAHEGTADAWENEGTSGPSRCCCCGHS